ncbi:hypothetical protein DPEC_G00349790 [Dallia pectoralis]|uniref:Uncharacterized protein n=1 Tax=Dallia pectoralis TaxID=75939 RepID=A0ACC2F1I8_DALPE|nr:hypothetical protein DPEC_G00349790 [Dallia pectoralis]
MVPQTLGEVSATRRWIHLGTCCLDPHTGHLPSRSPGGKSPSPRLLPPARVTLAQASPSFGTAARRDARSPRGCWRTSSPFPWAERPDSRCGCPGIPRWIFRFPSRVSDALLICSGLFIAT